MGVSPHHGPSSYLALHFDGSQGVVDDLTAGLFIRWDWIKHWLMGFGQKLGHPQNVKRLGTLKVQQKLIVSLLVAWNSFTESYYLQHQTIKPWIWVCIRSAINTHLCGGASSSSIVAKDAVGRCICHKPCLAWCTWEMEALKSSLSLFAYIDSSVAGQG